MVRDQFREDVESAVREESDELRNKAGRFKKAASEGVHEGVEQVAGLYDEAAEIATKATRHLRKDARSLSRFAHNNPVAATSLVTVVGIASFVLGVAVTLAWRGEGQRRS